MKVVNQANEAETSSAKDKSNRRKKESIRVLPLIFTLTPPFPSASRKIIKTADFGWSGSPSNFSRKLNEGTLRYDEAMELAKALGYEIRWEKVRGAND